MYFWLLAHTSRFQITQCLKSHAPQIAVNKPRLGPSAPFDPFVDNFLLLDKVDKKQPPQALTFVNVRIMAVNFCLRCSHLEF